jgi:hypothetical protein
MPTARELLEQADALMRRNRAREAPADDIPLLTEEVEVAAQEGAANGTRPGRAALPSSRRLEAADDVPELTEAVAYLDAVSIQPLAEEGGEVSRWLESELGEASITGPAPDSIAVVPPATLRPAAEPAPVIHQPVGLDVGTAPASAPMAATAPAPASAAAALAAKVSDAVPPPPAPTSDYAFEAMLGTSPVSAPPAEAAFDEELLGLSGGVADHGARPGPPVSAGKLAEPLEIASAPAAEPADDAARWAALAEEIRMQVLQRIDIFTDTGLQQQLTARLQPIVDRASEDLVATINQHVGTLLRAYVAEAIEREIEKWREGNR